jgi:hypothetical protein
MQALAVVLGVIAVIFLSDQFLGTTFLTLPPTPAEQRLFDAIEVAEGYGIPGAIPTRANNPLDITDVGQKLDGDTGQRLGAEIIVFDTIENGTKAGMAQVRRMLSGTDSLWPAELTLTQVGARYALDAVSWPANVASQLGVGIDATLGEIART